MIPLTKKVSVLSSHIDGCELGFDDGILLGAGDKVGSSEGTFDGLDDGEKLEGLGWLLGAFEATSDGVNDGDDVGMDDGSSDGELLGSSLGY